MAYKQLWVALEFKDGNKRALSAVAVLIQMDHLVVHKPGKEEPEQWLLSTIKFMQTTEE